MSRYSRAIKTRNKWWKVFRIILTLTWMWIHAKEKWKGSHGQNEKFFHQSLSENRTKD